MKESLHDRFVGVARARPDKAALIMDDRSLCYRDLEEQSAAFASGLVQAGVKPGDRVAVQLDPGFELVIAFYGILRAGAVFVPVHPSLRAKQVEHILDDCTAGVLVAGAARLAQLEAVTRAGTITTLIRVGETDTEVDAKWLAFDELTGSGAASPNVEVEAGDLAALLYTSGSTGSPKGVMVTHENLLAGTRIVSSYLHINEDDLLLAALPFSFDVGLNQLTTAIDCGATLVLKRYLFAHELVAAMEEHAVTGLAGVPTLWHMLTRPASGLEKERLPALRYVTNTGGALPPSVLDRMIDKLGDTEIVLMYGLTEAFRSTYLPPDQLAIRPASIGKAIPETDIWVLSDDGQHCAPGETGELVHRGPTVTAGYWNQPEASRQVLRPNPFAESDSDERVCYSGDLVRSDEQGYLFFVGRRDRMIKSSGFRISPTEVEQALLESGHLDAVAVIGLPDERLGHGVHAIAVSAKDSVGGSDAALEYCAAVLPRYMVPQEIELVDELPKTPHGKIDYPLLVAERQGKELRS